MFMTFYISLLTFRLCFLIVLLFTELLSLVLLCMQCPILFFSPWTVMPGQPINHFQAVYGNENTWYIIYENEDRKIVIVKKVPLAIYFLLVSERKRLVLKSANFYAKLHGSNHHCIQLLNWPLLYIDRYSAVTRK